MIQAMVEGLLKEYPNVLILRVRMPIVADLTYPRNFITKIIKYDKVCFRHPCLSSPLCPFFAKCVLSSCSICL